MKDHRVDLYLDPVTDLALKARARDEERSMSQHLRYLVKMDIENSLAEESEIDYGQETGGEGDDA